MISTTEHYTSHQSDHGPETDEHEEGSDGPIEAGHSVDVVEEEDEDQLEEEEHSPDKEEGSGHKQEDTESLKQEEEPPKQEVGSPKQEVDMMPSSPKQDLSSQRIEPEIMINSQKADVEIPHKDEVPLEKSVLKKGTKWKKKLHS